MNPWERSRRPRDLPTRYGKWALVAGASEGLGAAFAAQFARRGMHLVLIARRGHLLEELGERLTAQFGVEVRCLVLDLADPSFAEALVDAVGELDLGIVILQCGACTGGPLGGG